MNQNSNNQEKQRKSTIINNWIKPILGCGLAIVFVVNGLQKISDDSVENDTMGLTLIVAGAAPFGIRIIPQDNNRK